jgi:periplasmic protein TonB
MLTMNSLKHIVLAFILTTATSLFAQSVSDITDISPTVDVSPVPVRTPPPVYPPELRREDLNGLVAVVVVIDEQGNVIASEVSRASHDGFKQPALDAVKNWKFKPAKAGGKNVKVRVTIPIRFEKE